MLMVWYLFWIVVGYMVSVVKGVGMDVIFKYAYYFCRVGFSVVFMVIVLMGVFYWNLVCVWFICVEDF